MWPEIEKRLGEFASAVLTGVDGDGYPFSARCRPQLDTANALIRLEAALPPEIQPGPACLLCHTHDERLWNLKSFAVRGELETGPGGWVFRPRQYIPGIGVSGWRGYLDFVRFGRRSTRAHLARQGLTGAHVQWNELMDLLAPPVEKA